MKNNKLPNYLYKPKSWNFRFDLGFVRIYKVLKSNLIYSSSLMVNIHSWRQSRECFLLQSEIRNYCLLSSENKSICGGRQTSRVLLTSRDVSRVQTGARASAYQLQTDAITIRLRFWTAISIDGGNLAY